MGHGLAEEEQKESKHAMEGGLGDEIMKGLHRDEAFDYQGKDARMS